MEKILLDNIKIDRNKVEFVFSVSDGLETFFSGTPFVIDYPVELESVPKSILAIPFVCNVLPIAWLTNSMLILPELDKDFFDCIPQVKKGYETIFPESMFAGKICPDKIVENTIRGTSSGVFFSGGLDATQTLVTHFSEQPHLISIWGSDIRYDNEAGWKNVHDGIAEIAKRFSLPDVVIRSAFRLFDNERELNEAFEEQLKDNWWHGVKHGLALLGHAAPYAWLAGLQKIYIASSNCPADGIVRCASNPLTDNHVRFAGCRVFHDGYEFSRQDKAHNVVKFSKETGREISLHACWQSQTGNNCCGCEKCYRTMTAIIIEGGEPEKFGFLNARKFMPAMQSYLVEGKRLTPHLAEHHWLHIQNRLAENMELLQESPYLQDVKWIAKVNFRKIDRVKMPLFYRLRSWLANHKFYQNLHELKERLK